MHSSCSGMPHTYGTSLRQVNSTIVYNTVSFFVTMGTLKQLMYQLLRSKTHVQHNKAKTGIWKSTFNSHKSVTMIHRNLYSTECWGWSRQGATKQNCHNCWTHFHFKQKHVDFCWKLCHIVSIEWSQNSWQESRKWHSSVQLIVMCGVNIMKSKWWEFDV